MGGRRGTVKRRAGRSALVAVLTAAAAVLVPIAAATPATADPVGFSKATLHFQVSVGPNRDEPCDAIGDVYKPDSASVSNRVPAVLTTNGFGGSKDDQAGIATYFASHGYAVLAYSGLGFGGSGCKIYLDNPEYDGRAASELVSFLGGEDGIAFGDPGHTLPVSGLDYIVQDATAHNGKAEANDPRVGMIGGSYGGSVQFAAAAVDPRIDTIIPMITWNDLSYSLAPNSTGQTTGVSTSVPGATKVLYALGFGAFGVTDPQVSGYVQDPARAAGCPNFANDACPALNQTVVQGYPNPASVDFLRQSSVVSYADRVKIPVLLMQGEKDTLFDLNESQATFETLQAQGNDVKMIWQSWGHSDYAPAEGEFSLDHLDPEAQYETGRIVDWFDHYLKDTGVDTGPVFSYFRDWVEYTGNAAPAYAESSKIKVGKDYSLYLSGDGSLAGRRDGIVPGTQTLNTLPGGLPTDVEAPNLRPDLRVPQGTIPGTQAQWSSGSLVDPLYVVGAPTLNVRVTATPAVAGVEDAVVVFAKLFDVAPDGGEKLINGLVAPVRITAPGEPVKVTMPAIVHRFDAGHSVRLVLAGGDPSFRGGLAPHQVTIAAGDPGQELVLPVTGG
ncbi:alpha/beta fold hydrolase [Rhodococcus marinonascens]|uniref:alpha/beta fold hydrolase n=1 Tax=Rhodococcus marinonascens TaxID=38311 RepID=UPI000934CC0C|nr:alpha/beta fold hydrolase [Rhodococcus marinonascens]